MLVFIIIVWFLLCVLIWRSRRSVIESKRALLLCEMLPMAAVILLLLLGAWFVIELYGSGRLSLERSRKSQHEKWSPTTK